MAYLFHENMEAGGASPWKFDYAGDPWGLGTLTLANGSLVEGVNSLRVSATGEGEPKAYKDVGTARSDMFMKMSCYIPPSVNWGAENYISLCAMLDENWTPFVWLSLEHIAGEVKVAGGTSASGYFATGVAVPKGQVFDLQLYVKIGSGTNGRIKVWVDNSIEATPNYDSGGMNTGTTNIKKAQWAGYVPNAITSYYLDDFIFNDSFIVDESPPTVNVGAIRRRILV